MLARDHDPLAIYPVDWEMAWIGPGSLDLAALGGGWGAVERESLARAYLDGVGATGPAHPDLEELSASLARCRLHLALQWLGWSPAWRPPPEHAHDWLGEAWELAQELGLAA
jgi:thiamine kinase-like enzyme